MSDIVKRLRDVEAWCHVSTAKEAADEIERLRALLPVGQTRATHRHKKRGSEYVLIGIGRMQTDRWLEELAYNGHVEARTSVDMREVAIYRSVDDGSLWARPREEFEDGRFEALPAASPQRKEP